MKRRLIINADDLGINLVVNAQIEECIHRGCITSSTLMANAPAFEDGVRIAKQYPQISVGVHLNLIEFAPLTNVDVFLRHGIINSEGVFIDGAIFCMPIDDELRQAVFEEWDAQIAKVEAEGITPTHIDSHQHTHTIPALQKVLCRVMEKHKIYHVRRKIIPSIFLMLCERKNPSIVHLDKSKAMQPKRRNIIYRRFHLFVVKYYNWRWNRMMIARYSMTNRLYSFREFYYNRKIIQIGRKKLTIELMCHPGNTSYRYETENLLRDMSWFDKSSYKMISYNEI